ncbi:MAG TPA: gliding motility-associated C-terminal domain-containing protein [Bacteroidia bacterium]
MKTKLFLVFALFAFQINCLRAQVFDWVKSYGSEQTDAFGYMKRDVKSNYLYVYVDNWSTAFPRQNGKLQIDTFKEVSNQIFSDWIVKLDTFGRYLWSKPLFYPSSLPSMDFVLDSNNNFYFLFSLDRQDDSVQLKGRAEWYKCPKNVKKCVYVIKLDSSGAFLWRKRFDNLMVHNLREFVYSGNELLFSVRKTIKTTMVVAGDSLLGDAAVFRLDTGGNVLGAIDLGQGVYSLINGLHKTKNELTVFVFVSDSLKIRRAKLTFPNGTNHLVMIKLSLLDKTKCEIVRLTTLDNRGGFYLCKSILLSNGKFILVGSVYDSLSLNLMPKLNSHNQTKHLIILVNDQNVERVNLLDGVDVLNSRGSFFVAEPCGPNFITSGPVYGKHIFLDSITDNRHGSVLFCKFDTLLNMLWFQRTADSFNAYRPDIVVSEHSHATYMASIYSGQCQIGDYKLGSVANSPDWLLSKILDFSITRGPVRSGPYCAGDSILIPFTKDGNFNSDNVFIAELSDENGQFEGRHRELGRITTNKDSTVIGLLPLFDVISSKNYRIRILSTSPRVQSYYRYDALRLLIYSKDTANAGRDTTICYGGVTRLATTGGSKWRWSPGHLVEDSTARITYTKPITDSTLFRIIISDSSGCGKTDTAYKILRTYKPLQIVNSDTTLCKKGSVLTAKVQGGQPLLYPYVYRWYNDQGKLISKHHSLNTDTMHLNKLQLVAGDNCSGQNDSQWIQINDYPQPQLQLPQDTVVCHAQLYRLKIKAEGGKYPLVCWLANNKDTILLGHELDSTFLPSNGQAIKLIAHDDCSELSDTAEMKITVLMPLNAKLALTPDCYKDTVKLSANCSGGKRTSCQTLWYSESMQIIGSDSFLNYSSKGNQQHIIIQLSDGCSPVFKDTITLTPMLSAKLQVNKDEQCLAGNLFEFKVQVDTLNNNFMSQKVQIPSNDIVHSGLNYSASFKDTGHYKVQLKVQSKFNQCVDSTELMVYVRPHPLIHVNWIRSTDSYDSSRWRFSASANVPMRSYLWLIDQFPSQTDDTVWQSFHYEGRVKIHVTGTDVYGCIEDSTYWFDMVHRMRFYIPNAVTDNGDGINDDFYIPGSEYMQEYRLKIFNRWGEKVFDSDNPQEHFKPEFDAGSVYIYTLTIFDIYNERHLLKGVFEVLR